MWFNLWNVGFWMKPKNPKKNLSQLSREGNLTTNSPHITESLCNYNRAKQEFCTCSTVFGTFLLPSWDEYDVEFHFYQRSQHKSATFFSFFWTDLKTDNPFCGIGNSEWWWSETGISICGKTDSLFSIHFIHNYNKILKSDWLSTVLISAE